jgi:hypothetical protein
MELVSKTSRIRWSPSYRIVPSRFPPVGLFDRVANPADLEAVYAVEALTNPRLRQEAGEISLLPPEERVSGPGTTPIMAAFTHLNPMGSRFSDGTYGVYYAGESLDTAIAETRYHREKFLLATSEPSIDLDMRAYLTDVRAALHDIRGRNDLEMIYDPHSYVESQKLGLTLKLGNSWGLIYDSVRRSGGTCAGVFRPRALSNCRQGQHLVYAWNGKKIDTVYEKKIYATY